MASEPTAKRRCTPVGAADYRANQGTAAVGRNGRDPGMGQARTPQRPAGIRIDLGQVRELGLLP
jgi:hypothetical protein